MYQASYFYTLSRKSSAPALSVSIIPFTGQGRPEHRMGSILGAMDEVRSIEPEIIMLYATRESTELFLQQVIVDVALFSVSNMFFKTLEFDQKTPDFFVVFVVVVVVVAVLFLFNVQIANRIFFLRLFYVIK